MTDIDLNIDELILDGVPPEQQAAVIAALRVEVGAALARGATFAAPTGGKTLHVATGRHAAPQAIARGIVQGLTKAESA